MAIEGDRQAIMELPVNVEVLAGLRDTARLAATHYSTQIEGNRLTQAQVAEALAGAHFPGRERDEAEVRNYSVAQLLPGPRRGGHHRFRRLLLPEHG
jgi:hypothetical protein